MENASKALLMAGAVLIAILLLTIFSYVFSKMAGESSKIYEAMRQHEIDEFNQPFLNYEGNGSLDAQDIASVLNLTKNAKKSKLYANDITISLKSGSRVEDITSKNGMDWLETNGASGKKYKCTKVNINSETQLVDKLEFVELEM